MPPKKTATLGAPPVKPRANMAGKRKASAAAEPPPAKKSRALASPPAPTTAKNVNKAVSSKKTTDSASMPVRAKSVDAETLAIPKMTSKTTSKTIKKFHVEKSSPSSTSQPVKAIKSTKAGAEPKQKSPKPATASQSAKALPVINQSAPKRKLDVFVFGEGENAELGLGTAKNAIGVKRPRLNPFLPSGSVGVVSVACGGMHVVALTHDSKIYTWGVNDQGALGRDTTWDGGLKDMDDDDSDSSGDDAKDNGLNPYESTPTAIPADYFPPGIKFVQVAAGDSVSFALTDTGLVYGWGTFRNNEGILGFTPDCKVQRTPMLLPLLKNIIKLSCGANHALAMNKKGAVFAWGSGQQNQLGRRIVERNIASGLTPREFGLPKTGVKEIASGAYHSFAIDKKNNIWTWGLNNFGQCGIESHAGESEAIVGNPLKVSSLSGQTLSTIAGGLSHSLAINTDGDVLVWGRADACQIGLTKNQLATLPPENVVRDERDNIRILLQPTKLQNIPAALTCAAGSDQSIVITREGKAYSWGFSTNYQTGLGTSDDVETPEHIDNTATRDKELSWAGCGGQYSMLAAAHTSA